MSSELRRDVQITDSPEFSIILSCFNEEQTVAGFLQRLDAAVSPLDRTFEIIATDDGSVDGTFDVLAKEMAAHQMLSLVIRLFKNSGQAAGLTSGIERARGKNIVLIDSDLQLDPEELPMLIAAFDRGADIVTGYRPNRGDSLRRRLLSMTANVILRRASGVAVRDMGCTFKVLRGELVRSCNLGPMRVLRMSQILSLAGKIEEIAVTHHVRPVGKSGWTFQRLLSLLVDNLIGTSALIFQRIALAAMLVALILVARVLGAVIYDRAIMGEVSNGLLLNASFIWGLITVGLLALVGEFARQIYQTMGGRPAYVVKEVKAR